MFCFLFIDPRGTGGSFWPGRGSWGPQSHQRPDRRKNWPGMSPPWGESCVLCPVLVNAGSLSQTGLLDLELVLQSTGRRSLRTQGQQPEANYLLYLESSRWDHFCGVVDHSIPLLIFIAVIGIKKWNMYMFVRVEKRNRETVNILWNSREKKLPGQISSTFLLFFSAFFCPYAQHRHTYTHFPTPLQRC